MKTKTKIVAHENAVQKHAFEHWQHQVFIRKIWWEKKYTLSLGNCFGSKVKQHFKRTASKTQTQNQRSKKQKNIMEYPSSSWDQVSISAWPQQTFV